MAKKVRFNLHNVRYAKITNGAYGTPVAIPGAVSLDLSKSGNDDVFYADGVKYYISHANTGYTGSLEVARIPEQMLKDIYGMQEDNNGVLVETNKDAVAEFALLYQVDDDVDNECYAFYRVSAGRPNLAAATDEEGHKVQTQKIDIECAPIASGDNAGLIKASTASAADATVKSGWFTTVYTPSFQESGGGNDNVVQGP